MIKELEENLTNTESELLNMRKNENALNNKIYQLEIENNTIKKSTEKISKVGLLKNTSSNRSMRNLNLNNIKEGSLKQVRNKRKLSFFFFSTFNYIAQSRVCSFLKTLVNIKMRFFFPFLIIFII